jgi:hypothetical protein
MGSELVSAAGPGTNHHSISGCAEGEGRSRNPPRSGEMDVLLRRTEHANGVDRVAIEVAGEGLVSPESEGE